MTVEILSSLRTRPLTRLPPLNALKAFEAAARHLNFRLAAEELGVTQGAVAQQVRGLEATLRTVLFKRQARGLALTEEGRRYFKPVNRAIGLIADATEAINPGPVVVTISVTPSFAGKWLVPRLGRFTQDNPDMEVKIAASDGLANFQSDGVDIAVRQGKPPFGPGLSADLLFPSDTIAVCSPALAAGPPGIECPDDLAGQTLLHDTHGQWALFLEKAGVDTDAAPRSVQFSQTSLAIDAAIAGQGVALAPMPLVAEDIAAGRLIQALDISLQDETGFYVVSARNSRNPKAADRMRNWLLAQSESN